MNPMAADLENALDAAAPAVAGGDAVAHPDAAARPSRREAPRALLETASARGLVRMALEEWAAMLACWFALAFGPAWLYPLPALILAGRFHALGVILHDAAHMPIRRKTFPIWAVEALCGYPIATTLNAMRYHHLRHHRDSCMAADPYFKGGAHNAFWWTSGILRGVLLVPFWSVRAWFGSAAAFVPALRRPYARIFLQHRGAIVPRDMAEARDCARAEWGQLASQFLLIAAACRYPAAILWGYAVPVTLAGLLAARRVLIEHTHERVSDRKLETILATTRDNHLGIAGTVLLAPRNIGYHIVHHIHPQVRLGALPRLRAWYLGKYPGLYPGKTGSPPPQGAMLTPSDKTVP